MKGQLFSIEVLLTLIIMTLVVGYTVNSISMQQKRNVEESQYIEVQEVARRAAFLLAGNPDFECSLHARTFDRNGQEVLDLNLPLTAFTTVFPFKEIACPSPNPDQPRQEECLDINLPEENDRILFKLPSTIDLRDMDLAELGDPLSAGLQLHRESLGVPFVEDGYGCHISLKRKEPFPGQVFTSKTYSAFGCSDEIPVDANSRLMYVLKRNFLTCHESFEELLGGNDINQADVKGGLVNKKFLDEWEATITVWRTNPVQGLLGGV